MDSATDPFGLLAPVHRLDPYPTYERMRREAPVYYSEPLNCWMVTRYSDITACFRDERLSAKRAGGYAAKLPPESRAMLAPLLGNFGRWMLLLDPPDHTRLRGLIAKAFTPSVIEQQRPRIEALADDLLARLARCEEFDLISEIAYPLPVMVIGDLMGLPRRDADRLKHWSDALAAFLGATAMSASIVGEALGAVVELETYFRAQLESRRKQPTDDLLTMLLQAHEQDDRLDEAELLATATMLLFGGHETTTNLIGNGILALLRNPDQLTRLRAQPELIDTAIEEFLRYETPVLRMGRVALENFELGGQTIQAGSRVFMMLGSANRDPGAFREPDKLDIGRTENRHMSFGLGRHYCIGAALGRLEAKIVIPRLLEAFPRLRLPRIFRARWIDNLTVRGLDELLLIT